MCTKFVECLIYYDVDLLYMQVGFANAESKTTEANKIDQINVIGFQSQHFWFSSFENTTRRKQKHKNRDTVNGLNYQWYYDTDLKKQKITTLPDKVFWTRISPKRSKFFLQNDLYDIRWCFWVCVIFKL